MTDRSQEPLEQFLDWHDSVKHRAIDSTTMYGLLKEAFYAGYAARPAELIEPGPDVLEKRRSVLGRSAPPQPPAYAGPANRGRIVPLEPPDGPPPTIDVKPSRDDDTGDHPFFQESNDHERRPRSLKLWHTDSVWDGREPGRQDG